MKTKLKNICDFVKDKISVSEIIPDNYISTENMLPDKYGITAPSSVPADGKVTAYRKNDVLVSNIRPYFRKIWFALHEGGCSNDVLVFRAKNGISPDFLHYILADDRFFDYAMKTSKGTKMPRGDKKAIMEYEITEMDISAQKKAGVLLRTIDDKIALNNAINKNLEQQAQAVYQSMFASEYHDGDRTGLLSELITVKYGKDHKKLNDGIFPVYGSGGIMRYAEKPLYDKESVLIPRKGSLNNIMYTDEPFWSVDTMFFTEMKIPDVAKFVFHFLKNKDLASLNTGSAVPSMTTDILNSMKIIIPSAERLNEFENIVAPLYKAMKNNSKQSKNLSAIRDTLLPELMNGEIDVSKIQI